MARRTLVAALALGPALMLSSAMAQKVTLVREGGQFLAAGVREESGQLIFARPGGEVRVEVGSWQSVWVTASDFVALERRDDQGHQVRIYGRDGSLAGEVHVPPGRYGFVTKQRVVATPLSPHGVMVPHELDFYSFDGALVKSVREPELSLFAGMTPMDDGYVVTSSDGPGPEDRTLIVYTPDGEEFWRRVVQAADSPGVVLTPDHQRLAVIVPRADLSSADLTVRTLDDKVIGTHLLLGFNGVFTSPDSRWLAVPSAADVTMIDARTGSLAWRKRLDLDWIQRVRFDEASENLLIVAVKRDAEARVATLRLWQIGVADGRVQRADLMQQPLGSSYQIRDIRPAAAGPARVVGHDRVIEVGALESIQP